MCRSSAAYAAAMRRLGDRGGARPLRRLQTRAQAAEQQRQRDPDQRDVGEQPDDALLGGDGQRDRVRRRDDLLGAHVLARGGTRRSTSRTRSRTAAGRAPSAGPPGRGRRGRSSPGSSTFCLPVSMFSAPGASATTATPTTATAPISAITGHGLQRSAASTARPSSSAAKLDCESENTRPAHSSASAAAISATVAAAPRPQQHGGEQDHRQRQVAAEDVRVEEQRVDPEVGQEVVRRDDLLVGDQQVAGRELDAADRGERQREHRP